MKKILMVFGVLAGTLYSGCLLAVPTFTPLNDYEVTDRYWGAGGKGDVIGRRSQFDIEKAVFNRHLKGDRVELQVDIYTGFIANGGIGSSPSSTYNDRGIGLGDLFFSTTGWTPYKKRGKGNRNKNEHYGYDKASNGTVWDYAFSLGDNRWDQSGVGELYKLVVADNKGDHILLSDDFMKKRRSTYRKGQEVALNVTAELMAGSVITSGPEGSWKPSQDGTEDLIRFLLDVTDTKLATDPFGFHFGFLCANDVIEGDPPAMPEPALLSLLMVGFGIGSYRQLKK